MPEIPTYAIISAIPVLVAAVFAKSAWTDAKKSELHPFDAFVVVLLGIPAWHASVASGEWTTDAWAVAWVFAIIIALRAQNTLNWAYFRLFGAWALFFGAYGYSIGFLGFLLWSLVIRLVVWASFFYWKTFASARGREALGKYVSDWFWKSRWNEFGRLALIAAFYVLALKATFASATSAWWVSSEKTLLFIGILFSALPAILGILEKLFRNARDPKTLSAAVLAVLAAGVDFWMNGLRQALPWLAIAFFAWMAVMAVLAILTRVLKTYLTATKTELVGSAAFKSGEVLDTDFFLARFPFAKGMAKFDLPEWKASESDVSNVRDHVAEFLRRYPSVPDEFRIFKRFPLTPYALLSAVACAILIPFP